jgi:hypothetical protein
MQEHIRRAHPEHYIPKLPATEDSFLLMVNTPPQDRRQLEGTPTATQSTSIQLILPSHDSSYFSQRSLWPRLLKLTINDKTSKIDIPITELNLAPQARRGQETINHCLAPALS